MQIFGIYFLFLPIRGSLVCSMCSVLGLHSFVHPLSLGVTSAANIFVSVYMYIYGMYRNMLMKCKLAHTDVRIFLNNA
jgi:hypothetical protein